MFNELADIHQVMSALTLLLLSAFYGIVKCWTTSDLDILI